MATLRMTTPRLDPHLRRKAIVRGDPGYDEARALYNAMLDRKPEWIVACESADDVAAGIAFARDNDLLLAIRGGGHNGAGLGSCDGGLVLDLSPMKRISYDAGTGLVSVQAGCTQGEVDRALAEHGRAVPAGIVSSTGIAGLTLGGGHGHLTREYGLTIDNLVSADMVLADGSRVTASEEGHPELFWAIRGGGGNFGVVTQFTYRTWPVDQVVAGPIFYDVAHAAEVLRWYRDFIPAAPRKLGMAFGLKRMPAADPFPQELWNRPVCALICCYNGSEEEAAEAMREVRENLPEPLLDAMAPVPFADWQAAFDGLLPEGLQWYWKGDYVDELTDEAIAEHVAHGGNTPSNLSLMHLYPIDGAVHDVAPGDTAWGARRARWSMVIAGIDPDPAKAGELREWASDYWQAVHRHNPHGGAYVNFMQADEGQDRVRAAYGDNYDRLVEVKRRYDPENLFRVNQNIRP